MLVRSAVIVSCVSGAAAYVLWSRRRKPVHIRPMQAITQGCQSDSRNEDTENASLDGTEIVLVRHGRTEWNELGRIQGSKDSPLTQEGIEAARRLGRRLASTQAARPIVCAYASPLGRAWATASIVVDELPSGASIGVYADDGLQERSFGVLEGLTTAEGKANFPEAQRRNASREDDYAPPGGGESRASVRARAQEALLAIARRHRGERVLVVTHSALIASTMTGILNQRHTPNPRIRSLAIANTALNVLRWSGDGWQLVLWGDTAAFAAAASGSWAWCDFGAGRAIGMTLLFAAGMAARDALLRGFLH